MLRLFLGLLIVFFFVGCSSKEEQALYKSYKDNINYHKQLQKTEKVEIYDLNHTSIAILTATHVYTPNFEKNDTRDEVFIVGVAFDNPDVSYLNFDQNTTTENINEYTLTLHSNRAIKVVPLKHNDKRLKGISFVMDWANYYEVTYPHVGRQFTLLFGNGTYDNSRLNFAKVAKFVYTKKGF